MTSSKRDLSPLVRKLGSETPLSEEEVAALMDLSSIVREVSPGEIIVHEGDEPSQACLILDGLLCRYKITGQGARQIHSFHIAGDIPDLQSLLLAHMDHSISVLRPSVLAIIPHHGLHQLIAAHPDVGRMLWRETLVDGSIFREWLSNVGHRSALSRIAHVICELVIRFDVLGLLRDMTLPIRLTQSEIGDAQGLSLVHVNRVMKELREKHLIKSDGMHIQILDLKGLMTIGDFDPAYLHLHTLPKVLCGTGTL